MAKTCKCEPGDDILLGPNRPGPVSHRFDVSDTPIQIRLLGIDDEEDICVQIFSTAEVCDEEFISPAERGCCTLTLDCLQQSVTLVEPGRYFVETNTLDTSGYVVQALKFPATVSFTMDIGGGCE